MRVIIILWVLIILSYQTAFSQQRDSVLYLSNNSFEATTNASGSNGDYIQLPALGALANGNFTIETWFKVTDVTRSFQRIFEAGTGNSNNILSIGF